MFGQGYSSGLTGEGFRCRLQSLSRQGKQTQKKEVYVSLQTRYNLIVDLAIKLEIIMNASTDKKPVTSLDKKSADVTLPQTENTSSVISLSSKTKSVENMTADFRNAIKDLDAQRTELVRNAIDNIKPGRTFDSSVVRQINKLETKRNRAIVSHFGWLLKHDPSAVHAIVHQIIEL